MAQSVELTVSPLVTDRDDACLAACGGGPAPRGETRLLLMVGPRVPRPRGIDLRLTAPAAGVAAPGRGRLIRCRPPSPSPAPGAPGCSPGPLRSHGSAAGPPGRGTYRR